MSSKAPLVPGVNVHRRRVAYGRQAGATSLHVPVYTKDEGDLLEGRFMVPRELCFTQPHTNEHLRFLAHVKDAWDRWTDWRARRGWTVVEGTRQLSGPHEPLTESVKVEAPDDEMMFLFLARFKRATPLFVGLDDVLEMNRLAQLYGVTPVDTPWNPDGHEDSGWVDPVQYALERKERLGLRPEDHHVAEWRQDE